MITPPRVSVVMPTRNRVALLQRAIESVDAQTVADWELIIVDDGSDDGTPALLAAAAKADPRIRALRTDAAGAAAARNRAIAAAFAPYVAFLDDDDEWLPRKLERQLEVAAGDRLIYTGYAQVDERAELRVQPRRLGADPLKVLLLGNELANSTVLAPRDALLRVGGFDERLPRLQDWDLWIRLAPFLQFRCIPEPLARVHRTPRSISASSPALLEACDILAQKIAPMPRSLRGRGYFGLGQTLMFGGEAQAGRAFLRRSLRATPYSARRWLGAVSILLHAGKHRKRAATRELQTRLQETP